MENGKCKRLLAYGDSPHCQPSIIVYRPVYSLSLVRADAKGSEARQINRIATKQMISLWLAPASIECRAKFQLRV